MTNASFHLNLLKQSERLSSSPVRLRVIVPMLAFFSVVGMIVWWGRLFTQNMIMSAKLNELAAQNEARRTNEKAARDMHAEYLERVARLKQLDGYAASVRRIGPALAALAENMPVNVQLLDVSISEPPPQSLKPAKPTLPPLRGPTNTVERQAFTIEGRTAKPLYAGKLKVTMKDPSFAPLVAELTKETSGIDTYDAAKGEARATLFKFEYAMPERQFAPPDENAAKKKKEEAKAK